MPVGSEAEGRREWAYARMVWVIRCRPPWIEIPHWKGIRCCAKSGEKHEVMRDPLIWRQAVPMPRRRSLFKSSGSLCSTTKNWAPKVGRMDA